MSALLGVCLFFGCLFDIVFWVFVGLVGCFSVLVDCLCSSVAPVVVGLSVLVGYL